MATESLWRDFEWWRDPKGYSLHGRTKPPKTARIDRVGGELQVYRPLELSGQVLPIAFAKIIDDESAMNFVRQFGPLTRRGLNPRIGDYVSEIIRNAALMRDLMAHSERGDGPLHARLNKGDIKLGEVRAMLVQDPSSRKARVRFEIPDLLCALWLRLSELLSRGVVYRQCLYDGMPFDCGPGTERRLDATKFCSREHRTAYNNLPEQRGNRPSGHKSNGGK